MIIDLVHNKVHTRLDLILNRPSAILYTSHYLFPTALNACKLISQNINSIM